MRTLIPILWSHIICHTWTYKPHIDTYYYKLGMTRARTRSFVVADCVCAVIQAISQLQLIVAIFETQFWWAPEFAVVASNGDHRDPRKVVDSDELEPGTHVCIYRNMHSGSPMRIGKRKFGCTAHLLHFQYWWIESPLLQPLIRHPSTPYLFEINLLNEQIWSANN